MMKKNKTIAIFSGYYLPFLGGIERYTNKLTAELKKLGYNIVIITSNYNNLSSEEKIDGIKIYRLPIYNIFSSRYPIPKNNKEYKKIMKKIDKENIDFVICNTRFQLTTLTGLKFAKRNKLKYLIIEHGSGHFTINNKILDYFGEIYEHALTIKVKKYKPYFYGVSKRCNIWLKHFKINAKGVFYNSVDEKSYEIFKNKHYIKKNNKMIISYAGRLIKEKGINELIEAFTILEKKYKNIELIIAGDGPLLNELKEKQISKNIKLVGKLNYEEVMSLYNDTDIFVYPSMYSEGLPTSILEAGIMKCAIIATDRGGTKEVINNEKYGLIAKENTESIKQNIEILIKDQEKLKEMKNNIQKRILEEFTWNVTAKNVANEMEIIINEKEN